MAKTFMYGLVTALLAGSPSMGQEWATKMFPVTEHDFGTVPRGAKAEFDFKLSNIYLEGVHIQDAHASCGCTSVRVVKPALKTYEEGAIHATLNTGTFLGNRSATITVTLDRPFPAEVQLHVKGVIRNDVLFTPGSVQFGDVEQGKTVMRSVVVSHAGRSDWQILSVKSPWAGLTAGVKETGRENGNVWYQLDVRLGPDVQPGYLNDQLILVTNEGEGIQMPLTVEGRVVPGITVSPASLQMGVVNPGQEVTKQLVVRASKPFRILSITCDDKSFKFGDETDRTAKTMHVVPVTFLAGGGTGKVAKKIRIETDLGESTPELSAYALVATPVGN
ncbi:MAG: DUF1573 domain-containing protein [Thermoguttaceae bacterium]|jgi:hypothetical protein